MVKSNHAKMLTWLWLGSAAIIVLVGGAPIWGAAALVMSTVWAAADWVAMVTKGAPGAPGAPGPQGATGSQGPPG